MCVLIRIAQFYDMYAQHTITVLKIEQIPLYIRHLLSDMAPLLNLSDLSYPYLVQISMVPKVFEPLKFDCSSCWNVNV